MSAAKHKPWPPLSAEQLALRPYCRTCGWRKGGLDSWNGSACKCGHVSLSFGQFLRVADAHEQAAERHDALDLGDGDHEVAAAYHSTRASEIRAAIAKATGSAA